MVASPVGSATARAAMILAGFDVGTTAVKGIYFDVATRRVVAEASWEYPLHRPAEGHAEQDPADWLRGVGLCREMLETLVPGASVAAVGICSQVNTHVFVDAGLTPVCPAISWQDQRCAGAASELRRRAGDDTERIFGGPFAIDVSYALSRALWLQEIDPPAFARTRWILSPKDYCIAVLTGAVRSDRVSPVGLVGADGAYLADALALVDGAAERFPALAEFDEPAGSTVGDLGFAAGLSVSVGTMDAWSSLYGSGVVRAGQAAEMSGTSEIVGLLSASPGSAPGVISFPPVRGRYLHAGGTQAGGDALRWIADVLGMTIPDALAAAAAAGRQALLFLPHLAGERAPLWNADARAVFVGMTSHTTSGHLVRAVLEGVAHAARHLRERCEEAAGFRADTIRLSGGGASSELWNQIKADAHRCVLEQVASTMTGCLGAALMGGVAAGAAGDLESWAASVVDVARSFTPDRDDADRFDQLHAIYRSTYDALTDRFVELGAVSSGRLLSGADDQQGDVVAAVPAGGGGGEQGVGQLLDAGVGGLCVEPGEQAGFAPASGRAVDGSVVGEAVGVEQQRITGPRQLGGGPRLAEAESERRRGRHVEQGGGTPHGGRRRVAGVDQSDHAGVAVEIAGAHRDVRVDATVLEEGGVERIDPVDRVTLVAEGDALPAGSQRRPDRGLTRAVPAHVADEHGEAAVADGDGLHEVAAEVHA